MQGNRMFGGHGMNDRDHECQLQVEFAFLHEIIPGKSPWPRFRRWWKKLFLASSTNHRTAEYFRSSHALELERRRHMNKHSCMIHPFSKARLGWEIIMMILLMYSLIGQSLFTSWTTILGRHPILINFLDISDLLSAVDMILHFCTGKCKSETKDIVLHPKIVAWIYLKRMFLVDGLSALPYYGMLRGANKLVPKIALYGEMKVITMVKYLRIVRFLSYYDNTMQAFDVPFFTARYIKLLFLTVLCGHVFGCYYYYLVTYIPMYTGQLTIMEHWLGILRHEMLTEMQEYIRSVFRVVAILSGTCMTFEREAEIDQSLILIFVVVGQITYYVIIANAMHLLQYYRGSSSKYEEMTTQLAQFLRSKNLPPELTKRALDFYDFRYYTSYCGESDIMGIVSDRLRQDIISHDCKTLVERVPFIKTLSHAPKLSIVMCMRKKFYQASDVIIKLRDRGDSMFFIKTGTVAVYSSLGKEICHLEDGDHFGEISLLLKEDRVATVVAVEDCELYCLDREDFLDALDPYPGAMDEMVRVAKDRLKQAKDKV